MEQTTNFEMLIKTRKIEVVGNERITTNKFFFFAQMIKWMKSEERYCQASSHCNANK